MRNKVFIQSTEKMHAVLLDIRLVSTIRDCRPNADTFMVSIRKHVIK